MGQRTRAIGVVGADTAAGREWIVAAADGPFGAHELRLFGEEGEFVDFAGEERAVDPWEPGKLRGCDLVVLFPGAVHGAEAFAEAKALGARILDAGNFAAAEEGAPLIFPEINDEDLDDEDLPQVVRLPAPAAAQLALALLPLEAAAGLRSVEMIGLEAVAGAGIDGLEELSGQTVALLSGQDAEREELPHRIAFNLVPQIGNFGADGGTDHEGRIVAECSALLGRPVAVAVTSVQVPVFHGDLQIVRLETEKPLEVAKVRELFRETEGIKVLDEVETGVYPMPMLVAGDEAVHVGRLRGEAGTLRLITAADGLRFGLVAPLLHLAERLLGEEE